MIYLMATSRIWGQRWPPKCTPQCAMNSASEGTRMVWDLSFSYTTQGETSLTSFRACLSGRRAFQTCPPTRNLHRHNSLPCWKTEIQQQRIGCMGPSRHMNYLAGGPTNWLHGLPSNLQWGNKVTNSALQSREMGQPQIFPPASTLWTGNLHGNG
jgi:hypothetical protein